MAFYEKLKILQSQEFKLNKLGLTEIVDEGEGAPGAKVAQVILVAVSFALKGDIVVSQMGVTVDYQFNQPLYAIPQIEEHPQQLSLLP